jgi:Predicted Zn-dependent peptidases
MKRILFLFFVLFSISYVCFGQAKYPLAVSEHKLKNGFTVWINEDHTQSKVYGAVVVNAGAKDCPDTGIAHYFEHIMFKGTDKIGTLDFEAEKIYLDSIKLKYDELAAEKDNAKRKEIQSQINQLSIKSADYVIPNEFSNLITLYGGSGLNAFTSYDMTAYFNVFSPQYINQWLEINSERLLNPVFRLFQSELETVYEEKNMYSDALGYMALEKGIERYFTPHPYAYPIVGSTENLKNPRLSDMEKFFNDYYVAGNMCLVLSGDIKAEDVLPALEKTFGRVREGNAPKFEAAAPPAFNGIEKFSAKFPVPIIKLSVAAWRGVPENHPDELPLQVISTLLNNDNETGYLDKLMSDGKIMAGGVLSGGMNEAGFLGALVMPKIPFQSNAKGLALVMEQIDRIKKGDFEEETLNDIKLELKRNFELQLEDIESRSLTMISLFTQGKSWNDYLKYTERLDKLTKQNLVDIANKYFTDNYLLAEKKNGNYPKDRLQKPGFEPIIPKNTDVKSAYAEKLEQMPVLKNEPRFLDFDKDVKTTELTPKVNLYCSANPINDIFSLSFNFGKGKLESRLADFTSSYINMLGTDSLSFEQFKSKLQKLGSTMNFSAGNNNFSISIQGFDKNLDKTLELVGDFMKTVKGDSKKLKQVIDAEKVGYQTITKSSQTMASVLAEKVMYGNNSQYLQQLSISEMKKIKSDDLINEFRKLTSVECDIHYCGNLALENVRNAIKNNFDLSKITENSNAPFYRKILPVSENKIYFINDATATQSVIIAYIPGEVNDKDEQRHTSTLFNRYFGSGMSSIMFQEIREFRSLAYRANAYYDLTPNKHRDKQGLFYALLTTQSDKTNEAINLLDSLLHNMPEKPQRIETVKQNVINSTSNDYPSFREINGKIADLKQNNHKHDPNIDLINSLNEINFDNIVSFYKTNVQNKAISYIVVGNAKNINMDDLKRLGKIEKVKTKDIIKL